MPKKSFNEKLNHAGGLPKVGMITNARLKERCKADTLVVAAPLEYDALMKKIPKGRLITVDAMMAHLAKKHGADTCCPMTAGIFTNLAAHASEERKGENETPWWRTLRKGGLLSDKFPDAPQAQKALLEAEGHTVEQRGKKYFVKDYETALFAL